MPDIDLDQYTGGMTAAEVGAALAAVPLAQRQLKRALNALPSTKPTGSATLTMDQSATSYSPAQTISKDGTEFLVQCANLVQAGETYPNSLFNYSTGSITGNNTTLVYTISFYLYGSSFEFYYKAVTSSLEIFADGVSVASSAISPTGALRYGLVDFGTTKLRRIDMRCFNMYFGGFKLAATASMYPVADVGKIIVMGDSFTEGTGATLKSDGYASSLNWMLGSFNIWNSGSGGTGYVNPNSGGGRVKFGDRVQADIIDNAPHTVVVAGGINDLGYTQAEFQTEVDAFYSDLVAGLPSAKIVIVSPFYPTESATPIAFRDILQAKATEIGAFFIDAIGDGTNGYFTGTGDAGAPAGDGNADLFISSDGTHPTDAGHLYLAHRLGTELVSLGAV